MKALRIIEIYCRKWHLKISTAKAKIIILNKTKVKGGGRPIFMNY